MPKSTKPYPGMGAYVVLTESYPGVWTAYRGAATEARAKQYRRELRQWPDAKVAVVPNAPGNDPKYTTYYR